MSTEAKDTFKVVFASFEPADFEKVLNEHVVSLSGIAFNDLIGLDFVVMCTNHIPEWVVRAGDIVLPTSVGGAVKVLVSEANSVVGKWGTKEVGDAFSETWHGFEGSRKVLTEYPSDRLFTVGTPVQLRTNISARGALSLRSATEQIALTYRVKPSQVKITISSEDCIEQ